MSEVWKDVFGYEGIYQVSSLGRVRSMIRPGKRKERILCIKPGKRGYLFVSLSSGGKRKCVKVHRLVAIHFLPNPKKYPYVCHKDDVKTNNMAANLFWGDQFANMRDMAAKGRGNKQRNTHCPHGHEYTKENTYYCGKSKYRVCRVCRLQKYQKQKLEISRRYRAQKGVENVSYN